MSRLTVQHWVLRLQRSSCWEPCPFRCSLPCKTLFSWCLVLNRSPLYKAAKTRCKYWQFGRRACLLRRILSGPPAVLGGGGGRRGNLLAGSIYLTGFLSPSQSFCAVFINKEGKELWTFMCWEQLLTPPQNNGGSFVSVTSKCSFGNSKKILNPPCYIRPLMLDNDTLKVMLGVVTCFLVLPVFRLCIEHQSVFA